MDEIASEEIRKTLDTISRYRKREITLRELAKSLELFRNLAYDQNWEIADSIHNEWGAVEQVYAVMADLDKKRVDETGSKIVEEAISEIENILKKP